MNEIIFFLSIILISTILLIGYQISSIKTDEVQSFPAYTRLFDSWNKKLINNIKISKYDDCFAQGRNNLLFYEWPGTINGCDCDHIRYSWVRQEYYKQYRRKTLPAPCDFIQNRLECVNITYTNPQTIKKWRNHNFCGKYLNKNFTYFDYFPCNKQSDEKNKDNYKNIIEKYPSYKMCLDENNTKSSKPCGIMDTLGQELRVPFKSSCPVSGYRLKTQEVPLDAYKKKFEAHYKKYTREYERTHNNHKYDFDEYDFLELEKDNDYSKIIPVGFLITENKSICINHLKEELRKELEYPLFNKPRYTDKLNKCSTKISVDKVHADHVNHISDDDLFKIEDLIENSQEDKIYRFKLLDEYNKHIYYDQLDIAQNFMHSKSFPSLQDTNISLFTETYIGWKPQCRIPKEDFSLLSSNYLNFSEMFNSNFTHVKFNKKCLTFVFTIQMSLFIFAFFYFKNTNKYTKLPKKKRIGFCVWMILVNLACNAFYYNVARVISNTYNNFQSEKSFLDQYVDLNCSDEFTNLLLLIFYKDFIHNYNSANNMIVMIIFSTSILVLSFLIEVVIIKNEKINIFTQVNTEIGQESGEKRKQSKKTKSIHKSKYVEYSDLTSNDENEDESLKGDEASVKSNRSHRISNFKSNVSDF